MAPKPLGSAAAPKKFLEPTPKYRTKPADQGDLGEVATPIPPSVVPPPEPQNPVAKGTGSLVELLPRTPSVRVLTKYSPRLSLDRKYPANRKLLPCPPPKNTVGIDLDGNWIVKAVLPPLPRKRTAGETSSSSSANPCSSKQKVAHKPAEV